MHTLPASCLLQAVDKAWDAMTKAKASPRSTAGAAGSAVAAGVWCGWGGVRVVARMHAGAGLLVNVRACMRVRVCL